MKVVTTLFYIVIDVIIFLFGISVVVYTSRALTISSYNAAQRGRVNTTISEVSGEPDSYTPYTFRNSDMYEGEISGKNALNDIVDQIKANSDVMIYINGTCLNTGVYLGKTYSNYISTVSAAPLYSLINANRKYSRRYTVDGNGNILSVSYITM